jgi:hypothetical protein
MKKFNFKKRASSEDYVIADKMLDKNRKDMNLSNNQQGVVNKNINLSLPIKEKDNTIPMDKQIGDTDVGLKRQDNTEFSITEAGMSKEEVDFQSKEKKQVTDINEKTEEYNQKHLEEFKKAENDSKKDTSFWDKYVGVQLEGEGMPTKVDNNVPASASQLPNNPERFEGKEIKKMVMASLKDADAMLFNIYANAHKENRAVKEEEKQQIIDINSSKIRLIDKLSQVIVDPAEEVRDPWQPEYVEDVLIVPRSGKWLIYEPGGGGEPIDMFETKEEALSNYPEGQIQNG